MMNTRNYGCKNEELPVIGKFILFDFKRDMNDFTEFSPKFNAAYAISFEDKINAAIELLIPGMETTDHKLVTAHLYSTIDGLVGPINNLGIYVKMAGAAIPVSAYNFGFPTLRGKIHGKDAEGVLQGLRQVHANILKYKDALMAQGMTETFLAKLVADAESIASDNQAQYEIKETRKALVQSNTGVFNDLYADIMELCEVGKNLYRGKDPQKLAEYTFSNLLKNVRVRHKTKDNKKEDIKENTKDDVK